AVLYCTKLTSNRYMMEIPSAIEKVLGRRNTGQFAEFPVEVRLVGIAGLESDVDPPASRFVDAMSQRLLKSQKARVNARGNPNALPEEPNEVPVAVARLFNDFSDVGRRRKTA